ncbi:unnamed protein product [Paramecium pentaurelia]|uniref:Uncharacterized protein n=1 Tax=Paramecium pentaurelia TaxID=43138 RepID=A0A8S1YF90_9CILI|nr:unnamed protein product [Paramecium pentaurelia]
MKRAMFLVDQKKNELIGKVGHLYSPLKDYINPTTPTKYNQIQNLLCNWQFYYFKILETTPCFMLDDIYPLFDLNEQFPIREYKEILSKYVQKETEPTHDFNSRKKELKRQFHMSNFLFRNWAILNYTQIICPSILISILNVHLFILHEKIKLVKLVKCIPVDYDLLDLNIKAFVEFQDFHIIAQKPFLHLTYSTTLKQKKNPSILIDYANLKQYYGKQINYIIPFLQGRIQVQLYIIDANLIQKGKDAHTYVYYYNAEQSTVGDYFSLESGGVCISMQLEEDIIQLSIKSLQIALPTKLTQIGPIQTRITYQIFNLKKLQQKNGLKIFRILNRLEVMLLIQKHFTTCTQKELDQILQEIESHPLDLMIDPYANYMFVSLSQSYAPHQRLYILQTSLVSLISYKQEEQMVENSIKNNIIPLTIDSQGTHLIKKIIVRFSEDRLNYIFHKLMKRLIYVINNQFGLCLLKDLQIQKKFRKIQYYYQQNEGSFR